MTDQVSAAPAAGSNQGTPGFVSSTAGMSPTQAAAMKFVDSTRAELAGNLGNRALADRHRAALGHAIHGQPAAEWIKQLAGEAPSAEEIASQARPLDFDDMPGMVAAFAAMD